MGQAVGAGFKADLASGERLCSMCPKLAGFISHIRLVKALQFQAVGGQLSIISKLTGAFITAVFSPRW